ncbi:MAG: hypothetical protein HY814_02360 [Candidatus Riflebacteria bacterium]|nr:hypothetical protein [Candidatus Riflebacteria bacterium]
MSLTRVPQDSYRRMSRLGLGLACLLLGTAALLAGEPAASTTPPQTVGGWLKSLRALRLDETARLAAFLAMPEKQFADLIGCSGKQAAGAVTAAPAVRERLASRLSTYRGPETFLRSYGLAMLRWDQPAAAVAAIEAADCRTSFFPWRLVWAGCRFDIANLPELAERWYSRAKTEFARAGYRMDTAWPIVTSPALFLGAAAESHQRAGRVQRVEQLYRWMMTLGPASEELYVLHTKAAHHFEATGRPAEAARARARAEDAFDGPWALDARATIYSVDLGLVVGLGATCAMLLLMALLWLDCDGSTALALPGCRLARPWRSWFVPLRAGSASSGSWAQSAS